MHWYQGLFLRPQHLQASQRLTSQAIAAERDLGWWFAYGIVTCQVNAAELAKRRLAFDHLHVVLRSGTVVDFPDGADLPVLDLSAPLEKNPEQVVFLGLPRWQAERANTLQDAAAGGQLRYRVAAREVADENTGDDREYVSFLRHNARLLLREDDEMEMLALLRVRVASGNVVAEVAGPCLRLSAAPESLSLFREIANRVLVSRNDSYGRNAKHRSDTPEFVLGVVRTQVLARYASRLSFLASIPSLSCSTAYLELHGLLAELSAVSAFELPSQMIDYSHGNSVEVFRDLHKQIIPLLTGAELPKFWEAPFKDGRLDLSLDHISVPQRHYLGIKSNDSSLMLSLERDPGRIRLYVAGRERYREFAHVHVVERKPAYLPGVLGLHFFHIETTSSEVWRRISQERAATLEIEGAAPTEYSASLFMALPEHLWVRHV